MYRSVRTFPVVPHSPSEGEGTLISNLSLADATRDRFFLSISASLLWRALSGHRDGL